MRPEPPSLFVLQQVLRSLFHVLIAATREIHHDDLVFAHFGSNFSDVSQCVRTFEGGNDAFGFGHFPERGKGLVIGSVGVIDTAFMLEKGMLGPDCCVVESG